MKRKPGLHFLIAILLFFSALYIAVFTGSLNVSIGDLWQHFFITSNENVAVIIDMRIPRIFIAIFAGAALAVSGTLLQAVMKNPLADPGIIGVSSGASFLWLIGIMLFPDLYFWSPLFAFIGGALTFFLVFLFTWRSNLSPIRMILVGVALNAVFSSFTEILSFYNPFLSSGTRFAALNLKTWNDVKIIVIFGTVGLILALFLYKICNLLILSDDTLTNLGVSVTQSRILVSAVAVLLAGVATAVAGVIPFIGLLIPHISRQLIGSDHKWLIPFSALSGSLLLLVADTIGRSFFHPGEIPAAMIMAIIGGPFLIFLLTRRNGLNGS